MVNSPSEFGWMKNIRKKHKENALEITDYSKEQTKFLTMSIAKQTTQKNKLNFEMNHSTARPLHYPLYTYILFGSILNNADLFTSKGN